MNKHGKHVVLKRFRLVLESEFKGDQGAMAVAAGVDQLTISRNCSGAVAPSSKTLRAISVRKHISLDWLEGKTGSDDRIEHVTPAETTQFEYLLPLVFTPSPVVPRGTLSRQTVPVLFHPHRYYVRASTDSSDGIIRAGAYVLIHAIESRSSCVKDIGEYRVYQRGEALVIDCMTKKEAESHVLVYGVVVRVEIDINEGFFPLPDESSK